jgi:predicted PurR-regulated permease PerM
MGSLRNTIRTHKYLKFTLLIGANAAFLYAIYFTVKHFNLVWGTFWGSVSSFLTALTPLWIGLIIAYIISPLVDLIDGFIGRLSIRPPDKIFFAGRHRKARYLLSIVVSLLLIFAFLFMLVYGLSVMIIGSIMVDGIATAINSIIEYTKSYETVLENWVNNLPEGQLSDRLQEMAQAIVNWLAENFSTQDVVDFVMGLGGGIVNMVLGIIVSIYLMYDRKLFLELAQKFLALIFPSRFNTPLLGMLKEVNFVLSRFIRGALLDAVIVAVLSSIVLSIIGLEFSVFIGCFAGLCNVIPYFGPIMGMIPAFIVGTFTEGIWMGVIAVLALLLLQQVDGHFIYPKVVGSQTGLHPLFVLISVTFAAYFGGIVGMLIAVPIVGVLRIFVVRWATAVERKRSQPEEEKETCQVPSDPPDSI